MPLHMTTPGQLAKTIDFIAERLVSNNTASDVARMALAESFNREFSREAEHPDQEDLSDNASKKILLQAVTNSQQRGGVDVEKTWSPGHRFYQKIKELLAALREGPLEEIATLVRTPQERDIESDRQAKQRAAGAVVARRGKNPFVNTGRTEGLDVEEGGMMFSEDTHCPNYFNSTLLRPGRYRMGGEVKPVDRKQISLIGNNTRAMLKAGLNIPVFDQSYPGRSDSRNCVGRLSQRGLRPQPKEVGCSAFMVDDFGVHARTLDLRSGSTKGPPLAPSPSHQPSHGESEGLM